MNNSGQIFNTAGPTASPTGGFDMMSLLSSGINSAANSMLQSSGSGSTPQLNSQITQALLSHGSTVLNNNVGSWLSWLSLDQIRPYFQVSNDYVWKKTLQVQCPFMVKDWTRKRVDVHQLQAAALVEVQQQQAQLTSTDMTPVMQTIQRHQRQIDLVNVNQGFQFPRDDPNAPDLYLPLTGYITFLLLLGYSYGLDAQFHPEVLASSASMLFVLSLLQLVFMRFLYFIAASDAVPLLDLYSQIGYQYLGYIIVLASTLVAPRYVSIAILLYLTIAHSMHIVYSQAQVWPEELGGEVFHPFSGKKKTVTIGVIIIQILLLSLFLKNKLL